MKLITTLIFLLIFAFSYSQPKRDSKNYHDSPLLNFRSQPDEVSFGIQCALFGVSGIARGIKDLASFNYPKLKGRFPSINDQFCNPSLSYKNKYKDGNSDLGAKYPLSTTALVPFTDLYHLSQLVMHTTLYVSAVIPLYSKDESLPIKNVVARYIVLVGVNSLAYHFAYDRLFRL